MDSQEFTLTQSARIGFDGAKFPELISGQRDAQGLLDFTGTIAVEITGYKLSYVINGIVNDDDDHSIILDGGLTGDMTWKQGRTIAANVTGFIEDYGNDYFVIHPQKIV